MQTAAQILGLAQQTACLVAFGIFLGRVHIALAIHDLVVLPIDDRTACHAHLERLGIGAHEVGGHESTETPTVHADAVGIHIGKGFQESHTRHLVGHFDVA